MKNLNLSLLLVVLLFTSSCNDSGTDSNPPELLNRVWILKAFETNGVQEIPPNDQLYNIQFKTDKRFSGVNDCNTIAGDYDLNGNNIALVSISSTEVYCGKESMDHRYLEALRGAGSFKIENDELIIYNEANSNLIFNLD